MENKRLTEPLNKALKEVEHLRHELANYQKEKESLLNQKARVKQLESEIKKLKWELEVMEQRFAKVQKERDELYEKFVSSIHEVQQKSGFKNLILEKKLEAISSSLETREVQLKEVIKTMSLDPTSVRDVTQNVENILEDKNKLIKDLSYELARVKKSNKDLIHVYESKMREFGVPIEDLGITTQVRSSVNTPLSPGPVSPVSS